MGIAKITAKTKDSPKLRSQLRQYLEPRTNGILESINQELLKPAIEKLKQQGKEGLVVIVDNLDRIDNSLKPGGAYYQPEYLFVERGEQLNQLNCHVVYTIPLVLIFSNALAFKLKQEQFQIEHQYGFRAFVGASYLNPQRQAINPAQLQGENTDSVAQEIAASGRGQDVQRLRERISSTQHKLTVIHGQSGVGKSSILQGGLIPALQQEPIEGRNVLPILLRGYTDWVGMLGQFLADNIKSLNANFLDFIAD